MSNNNYTQILRVPNTRLQATSPFATIAAQGTGGNCFGGQARFPRFARAGATKTARGAKASSFAPPTSREQARGQALAKAQSEKTFNLRFYFPVKIVIK